MDEMGQAMGQTRRDTYGFNLIVTRSMAEHLASIFGTEKDRVNCPFYFKIGACRHGDRCSRLHNRPTISQTMLLKNMYQNPVITAPLGQDGLPVQVDEKFVQSFYEEFYEDVFEEVTMHGEVENLNVCGESPCMKRGLRILAPHHAYHSDEAIAFR